VRNNRHDGKKTLGIVIRPHEVRGILAGAQTQLRYPLHPAPFCADGAFVQPQPKKRPLLWRNVTPEGAVCDERLLPYSTGDLLWVKEAWRCSSWAADGATIMYRASQCDGCTTMTNRIPVKGRRRPLRVTKDWLPAGHMPRWVSRLTLELSDIRIQRLQEISASDALAAGPHYQAGPEVWTADGDHRSAPSNPRESFACYWDSVVARRGFGWDVNPWVVAVTFEPHRQNVDDFLKARGAA
jgi:hypothetical protein